MSIQTELLALKNNEGLIVVEAVHRWAKDNPSSDLHSAINWDEPSAAYQHQLWQIRQLVAFHITSADSKPQFVSLSTDRVRPGGGYRDLADVLPDKILREVLLDDALQELQRVQERYKQLEELAKVWQEAETVKQTRRRRKPAEVQQVAAG